MTGQTFVGRNLTVTRAHGLKFLDKPRRDDPEVGVKYGRGVETGGDLHGALARSSQERWGQFQRLGESRARIVIRLKNECRSMPCHRQD